jgi:hypothetical protein
MEADEIRVEVTGVIQYVVGTAPPCDSICRQNHGGVTEGGGELLDG